MESKDQHFLNLTHELIKTLIKLVGIFFMSALKMTKLQFLQFLEKTYIKIQI